MTEEIYFKIIAIMLVLIVFLVRFPYTRKQAFNKKQILKGVMILILIFLYIFPFFDFANLEFNFIIRVVGVVIYPFGLFIIVMSHQHLGKNWHPLMDVKNSKNIKLIKKGPYKYVRHPIYLSWIIIIIGVGIFTLNIIFLAFPLIIYLVVYASGIEKEERILINKFGKEYKAYMKTTGRLIPQAFGKTLTKTKI